jgi:hypothetical protein
VNDTSNPIHAHLFNLKLRRFGMVDCSCGEPNYLQTLCLDMLADIPQIVKLGKLGMFYHRVYELVDYWNACDSYSSVGRGERQTATGKQHATFHYIHDIPLTPITFHSIQ